MRAVRRLDRATRRGKHGQAGPGRAADRRRADRRRARVRTGPRVRGRDSTASGRRRRAARARSRSARDIRCSGSTASPRDLGGEFFRWEFATAAAGALLGLNPFDEPNVREAKTRTLAQLDARSGDRRCSGSIRRSTRGDGYSRREFRPEAAPRTARAAATSRFSTSCRPIRIARSCSTPSAPRLRQRLGLATTHGIGPRYLHSTGQFHKGGPNTGIFVLLTATDASATPVPGTGLHVQHAEAGAGARRLRRARRQRPPRRALPPRRSDGGLFSDAAE